jgi:integration host factor subunit beta
LTKSDLIADLAADNPHLRVADVELLVATIFDQITGALVRGARIGHNPRTGVTVQVSEKTVPYFRTGKEMRGRLNRGGMKLVPRDFTRNSP